MKNSEITDPLFREAVEAIGIGNLYTLQHLLRTNPQLVRIRLDFPKEGYFSRPYLLWFIADNPIRHEKLPANIAAIARLLITVIKDKAPESLQEQVDYTLGLVATGRIPHECGVQIELIDTLIDAGAVPGSGHGAIAHGNIAAARHIIERGGKLTLATAVCLDLKEAVAGLSKEANDTERQVALVAAAFYGKTDAISFLIKMGVHVNAYPDASSGFHSHATALHQAVSSGSLDAVKLLVKAGADLAAKDRIYAGTPLDWAQYLQIEEKDEAKKKKFAAIEKYLAEKN